MSRNILLILLSIIFATLILNQWMTQLSNVQYKTNTTLINSNINNDNKKQMTWDQMIQTYLSFPLDQHYGSHSIVLLAAIFVCQTGPMLELGMGSSSTPLMSRISREQKRILVSVDSDLRWINYFSSLSLNNSFHKMKYVEVNTEMGVEWGMIQLDNIENWSIILLDHRPGPRRQFDLMIYSYRGDLVILHDTEKSSMYKYDEGLKYYPYHYRFTRLKTYTDVLSSRNASAVTAVRQLLESIPDNIFGNQTSKEILKSTS